MTPARAVPLDRLTSIALAVVGPAADSHAKRDRRARDSVQVGAKPVVAGDSSVIHRPVVTVPPHDQVCPDPVPPNCGAGTPPPTRPCAEGELVVHVGGGGFIRKP